MQLPENNATIITFYFILTQKHLNYHLKGTTSERSAELDGENNERQLCVGAKVLPNTSLSSVPKRVP